MNGMILADRLLCLYLKDESFSFYGHPENEASLCEHAALLQGSAHPNIKIPVENTPFVHNPNTVSMEFR